MENFVRLYLYRHFLAIEDNSDYEHCHQPLWIPMKKGLFLFIRSAAEACVPIMSSGSGFVRLVGHYR